MKPFQLLINLIILLPTRTYKVSFIRCPNLIFSTLVFLFRSDATWEKNTGIWVDSFFFSPLKKWCKLYKLNVNLCKSLSLFKRQISFHIYEASIERYVCMQIKKNIQKIFVFGCGDVQAIQHTLPPSYFFCTAFNASRTQTPRDEITAIQTSKRHIRQKAVRSWREPVTHRAESM